MARYQHDMSGANEWCRWLEKGLPIKKAFLFYFILQDRYAFHSMLWATNRFCFFFCTMRPGELFFLSRYPTALQHEVKNTNHGTRPGPCSCTASTAHVCFFHRRLADNDTVSFRICLVLLSRPTLGRRKPRPTRSCRAKHKYTLQV